MTDEEIERVRESLVTAVLNMRGRFYARVQKTELQHAALAIDVLLKQRVGAQLEAQERIKVLQSEPTDELISTLTLIADGWQERAETAERQLQAERDRNLARCDERDIAIERESFTRRELEETRKVLARKNTDHLALISVYDMCLRALGEAAVSAGLQAGALEDGPEALFRAIDRMRADIDRLTCERDEAEQRGRAAERADVVAHVKAKFSPKVTVASAWDGATEERTLGAAERLCADIEAGAHVGAGKGE